MIGISVRSTETSFCRSSPLRSGKLTSRIRQFGTETRGRARNSRADSNSSGCQPAERIKSSSDSRTEMSSSTTNTTAVSCDIIVGLGPSPAAVAWSSMRIEIIPPGVVMARRPSARTKSRAESLLQGRVAERLEQAIHRALLDQTRPHGVVPMCGDEHNRDRLAAAQQFPVQLGSRHSRHRNVEDQASGLADTVGLQELVGGGERLHAEAEFLEQVGQ